MNLGALVHSLAVHQCTRAQRSAAIKRRREIWAAMHPDSGNAVPSLGGRGDTSFAADTAAAAGITKRSINEHLARADALGDDLEAVVGTSLALAGMTQRAMP